MSESWRRKLAAGRVVLIDGGTGSELRARGFELSTRAWSGLAAISHQDLLKEIHADYIRAGAEVITANTFGTNRFVLESAGHGDEFRAINDRAVDAAIQARDATGAEVAIAGSISCLPPGMDASAYPDPAAEERAYRELAEQLAERGIDLIVLEMMQDDEHARRACAAADNVGLPWWLGLSCRLGADGRSLVGFDYPGTKLDVLLRALLPCGATVVNVMHTPPAAVKPALAELKRRWRGFIGAYPVLDEHEAGSPQRASVLSPDELGSLAGAWIDAGARVLGGCCGATPDHIRALRDVILDRDV